MAEALAALYAMLFCQELGFTCIIFEGDVLQIVKAINSKMANSSCYRHFVEKIQTGLCNSQSFSFTHVIWDANFAAHGLAKQATNHVIDKTSMGKIPPSVYSIVG